MCACGHRNCWQLASKLARIYPHFRTTNGKARQFRFKNKALVAGRRATPGVRLSKAKRNARVAKMLGVYADAKHVEEIKDDEYFFFNAHHFNADLVERAYYMQKTTKTTCLPTTITKELAAELPGWNMDTAVQFEKSGEYLVLPDVPLAEAKRLAEMPKKLKKVTLRRLMPVAEDIKKAIKNDDIEGVLNCLHGFAEQQRAPVEAALRKSRATIAAITQALKEEKDLMNVREVEALLHRGGLSRSNILNRKWHELHPNACRQLFGYEKYEHMVRCITKVHWSLFDETYSAPDVAGLTDFEAIVVTRMYLHLGYTHEIMALIWNVPRRTLGDIFAKWAPQWAKHAKRFCRLPVSRNYVVLSQPAWFKDRYNMPISVMVDGKDITIDTPRQQSLYARWCYSNKEKFQAVRGITWSGPHGLVQMTTDLFCGRTSEAALVKLYMQGGGWSSEVPIGTARSEDRGFAFTTPYYCNFNRSIVPAFLGGRHQFVKKEVYSSALYSADRYSCESVFSRVAKSPSLGERIPARFFSYTNAAWLTAHARANTMQPIAKPANWDSLDSDWDAARPAIKRRCYSRV